MTYDEALRYLAQLGKFGINLGLTRIEMLLKLMGNPERRFKSIHITGTNGKGSTTAMIASIFKASGIKTGMYTSPHLNEYTERIVIDGQEIAKDKFAAAIEYTSQFVTEMVTAGVEHPTEFEVLTAAAFYCFAEAGVEFAVIEVGLGGLLDSTNVIRPEVAVITNVALEHTERCGNTIIEVATHKAGIIKSEIPVVTAEQNKEAFAVISARAAASKAKVYQFGRDFTASLVSIENFQQTIDFKFINNNAVWIQATGSLIGSHQVKNSAVAIMTALLIGEHDKRVNWSTIKGGLATTRWPGRFEIISYSPVIVIDGAHNPAGAAVLRENLDNIFTGRRIVFLLGILKDKDVTGIIKALIKPCDKVIVTTPLSERAGDPNEIAREIEAEEVKVAASIEMGIKQAKLLAKDESVICVAGSLYLIGAVRALLSGQKSSH